MIDRYHEGPTVIFRAYCDLCDAGLPPELSFQDAVDAAKKAGWQRVREGKSFIDICEECAKIEKS